MERDLTGREAAAAVLVLAVAGWWLVEATRSVELGPAAVWAVAAFVLIVAALGVVRGHRRMTLAVYRSARTMGVVLALLALLPLEPAADPAAKLLRLLPGLLWCVAVAVLLQPAVRPPEPPAAPPPSPSPRRRKKKRR